LTARKRRILIAEDSRTQAERLKLLLEGEGYSVEPAGNGREGLERVKARPPDLIISDIVMPEMDGFAFCQAVKSAPATRRTPFVLLTAQHSPMDILHGLERGADNFITKPFEDDFLLERIRRIFENLDHRKQGGLEMEVTVRVGGREIVVNADKQQMIELLFSTSEELSDSNKHLEEARLALEEQAHTLERTVQERTRALREAEARYRTLLEQMPAVVYIADHDRVGRLSYISPQIEATLGFSVAEWMGDGNLFAKQVHPGDRERVLGKMRELRATGEPVSTELRMLARDGRVVWFSNQVRVIWGEDRSRPLVQGFLLDITERKRTDEALLQQRAFLRQVVDASPSFIFAKDRQGRFTLANQAVAEAYGTTVETLLGKTDADFNPQAEQVEAFRRDDLEVLDSGRERVIPEEVITDASGQRRWLYTVKRPLVGRKGVADQVLGVSTDITERKRAEDQLRQSQKMEAVGQLAGGVAHDFNNLLGVITGYAGLLLKDIGPEHTGARRLEQIHKAADRAAALTRQLLAFSRKQVLQPRVLDLNAVVSDVEKMLGRLIGEDIQIITVLKAEGRVKADPGQIEQVVMNLAVNARDAMPRGGKLVLETDDVELDENYLPTHPGARPGPHVLLAVSDTGHGIDAETLTRIFEPFFTTKDQGKGTGLGLSTVYGIVKQSGGYIMVYSEPGRGSTFKVYLPRVEEEAEAVVAAVVPPEPSERASETILLVEDEKSLREMVREILEEGGYTVLEGGSPEEALAAARSHAGPIHLMLTDVVMPRMGGRDLAAELAALRPDMRVLYMSGYTDNAIVHHGVLDAGTHFLQKPFTTDALFRKVRAVLDEPRDEP
jgi:PAS domain S-box-containing protein